MADRIQASEVDEHGRVRGARQSRFERLQLLFGLGTDNDATHPSKAVVETRDSVPLNEVEQLGTRSVGGHSRTLAQPSADALTPRALRTRGPGRVLVLSASGVRTLMRDVPSIQDKVLAALTARLSDD